MTAPVALELAACPLGCPSGDQPVVTGRDRLHRLPGDFTVIRCRTCGLLRTSPRPTPDVIGMYYPDSYGPYTDTRAAGATQTPVAVPRWKQIIRRWLDPKTRIMPELTPGRMLEVGCGSGAFLQQMARAGWDVEGLELSSHAGEAARSLGFPVFIGSVDAAPDPVRLYDLVVGWMVLEHVYDPVQTLQQLRAWTAPGGWLVLSVPDAGALEFRLFRDSWYALDVPRHLFHFTPSTIRQVLARGGWQTERIFWHDNPNNLLLSLRYRCQDREWSNAAEYLRDIVEGRRWRLSRFALGKLMGALRTSGRMTIWARRAADQ